LRLIREILFHEPKGQKTDIVESLHYVLRMIRKQSVIFLLSDFLDFESTHPQMAKQEPLFQALRLLAQKHDLICGILSDPREWELPSVGYVEFEDSETGESIEVNTSSPKVQRQYRELNRQYALMRDTAFRQSGVDFLHLRTDQPYIESLMRVFQQRSRSR
jgi:hypothetical protein